jgi:hypothetical protein
LVAGEQEWRFSRKTERLPENVRRGAGRREAEQDGRLTQP